MQLLATGVMSVLTIYEWRGWPVAKGIPETVDEERGGGM